MYYSMNNILHLYKIDWILQRFSLFLNLIIINFIFFLYFSFSICFTFSSRILVQYAATPMSCHTHIYVYLASAT